MRISDWSSDVCSSDLEHGVGIRTGDYLVPGLNFLTADGWLAAALMADSDTGGRFRNRPLNRACKGRSGDCRHPHQTEFYPMHGNPPQMRRSEERREGKECVSTCKSRGSPSL